MSQVPSISVPNHASKPADCGSRNTSDAWGNGELVQAVQRGAGSSNEQVSTGRTHRWLLKAMDEQGPGVLRMLWRLLGQESDVLDAYQECWYLLARLSEPLDVRCVNAYVYRTASNVAIEMIRCRNRRRGHWSAVVEKYRRQSESAGTDSSAGAAGESTSDGDVDLMREMIGELPPHLRNVLVLRDLSGMSYKEVGKLLGIEPTTARVYRRQAVLKLADLMAHTQQGQAAPEADRGDASVVREDPR